VDDAARGCVLLNDRSGAEANISAGLAVLDDLVALSSARNWSGVW
jgi:hypothetical protein